ncbi:alpha-1,2-fucosyltransferase [Azospirillum sp.]|uniref:alpha-1,2-fucosyltransferase n=1 Tax=Azospirillum sp. TaxID=34012 RepID=UPI00260AC863|nr:alpha-1,2-fucosyltransferase [Azospirillum sp.]
MIIVRLTDGLGNQMFQYAFGRALSVRRGQPLRLDLSAYQRERKRVYGLNQFLVSESFPTQEELERIITRPLDTTHPWWDQPVIKEPHFHHSADVARVPSSGYFVGYWQSERHFIDLAPLIRLEFTPRQPLSGTNLDIARMIAARNAVSLHVRRGDYASDPTVNALHGVCSLDYYRQAVAHIAERIERPEFFVFSDDPEWTRANLKLEHPAYLITHNRNEPVEDLRLMSLCRHHIIANSSFSWWGAWLAERPGQMVCAPRRWFAAYPHDTRDLVPERWTRLDG